MEKMKFAIIGCGNIAPYHAQAIINDPRSELAGRTGGCARARVSDRPALSLVGHTIK